MNLSINPMAFKADPKVLKKVSKLKDGITVNLEIISKAPKTYTLNSSSYLGDKFVSAYGEVINNVDRFKTRSQAFMEKMEKTAADKELLTEIKEYFTSISK